MNIQRRTGFGKNIIRLVEEACENVKQEANMSMVSEMLFLDQVEFRSLRTE